MRVAKTCTNCNNYQCHRCKTLNIHVSNIATCDRWIPKTEFVMLDRPIEVFEYDEHKIEVGDVNES